MIRRLVTVLLCGSTSLLTPAHAAWPVTGYPLCNVPEDLAVPVALSDLICTPGGCGGMLAFYWQDQRASGGSIYTAAVNDALPPDPPPVSEATLFLERPGAQIPAGVVRVSYTQCPAQTCPQPFVIAWTDAPELAPSVVRARREGEPGVDWGVDGVTVADAEGAQMQPSLIHDEHGGVIVAWLEVTALHRRVFAQRLDASGGRLWGSIGVQVGSDTTLQTRPQIAPDGVGGAYLLRGDMRGGASTLALFRLGPDGAIAPGWPTSGVVLGTQPEPVPEPLLRVAGPGAWVVWSEVATLSDASPAARPFVSLVDSSGVVSPVFTAAGVSLATGLDGDAVADDAAVGPGDDITVTYEYTQRLPAPSLSQTDLFAVRFEVEGSRPAGWPETGLPVCDAPGVQRQGRLFRQGGGAFLAWTDERSGDGDIYAQRLLDGGGPAPEWPAFGLLVCGFAGTQQDPVIGPNTVGGGFVAWRDGRDGLTNAWDLYAHTVSYDARLDVERPLARGFALSPARPNPATGPVRFRMDAPEAAEILFEVFDVAGRTVHRERFPAAQGSRELPWDLRAGSGDRVRPGLYLVRARVGPIERSTRVVVTE